MSKLYKNIYFGHSLDNIEIDILLAFSTSGILVLPDVDYTRVEINQTMSKLIKKKYVKGARPWKLTKLGFKLKSSLIKKY